MTRPQFSASDILDRRQSLKPTSTVVRTTAILCHGWEEAAVEDPAEAREPDEISQHDSNQPAGKLEWLEADLEEWKKKLRPTTTVIRTTTSVYDTSKPNDSKLPVQRDNLGVLVSDHGFEEMHGFKGSPEWPPPVKITHCDSEARPGYASKLAHEYEDTAEVLQAKVVLLAQMIRASRNCLLYTGAVSLPHGTRHS
jgi:hypothetical protein